MDMRDGREGVIRRDILESVMFDMRWEFLKELLLTVSMRKFMNRTLNKILGEDLESGVTG